MTNIVTVSNLYAPLDSYRFTAIATNDLGMSDESNPAALRWMTVCESDSLSGPWTLLATNSFATTPQHFIRYSKWSAASMLKKD
jgi:hypothetical protein